jgi:tetratricopeptide (TPR) repeat protein
MASKRKRRLKEPAASDRRGWQRSTALAATAATIAVVSLLAWLTLGQPPPLAPVTGPIVIISIDTLRADRLPVYGFTEIDTPAIDRFAAESVLFERAYTHVPQTLPAHASILSGRLPFENGVRDNLGFVVDPDEILLPDLLRDEGIVSGAVVSSYVLRRDVGLARGFDFYDDQMPVATGESSIGQVQRAGVDSLAVAERWLDSLDSNRFFLLWHIYEPHTPYAPLERYAHYGPYNGEVAFADEIVGRFLDALKARGVYDDATIVLLSDHGEGLGDHAEQEHGIFLYDESIRVPFIIKLPGGVNGGARVPHPVQHIDVLPTMLDLLGLPARLGLRGRSLVPVLRDPASDLEPQGIYSEGIYSRYHFGWSELLALTGPRYRYIKAPREELYDLDTDPGERDNIALAERRIRTDMRAELDRLTAGEPIAAPSAVSDEARGRLEALGYVGGQPAVGSDVDGESLPDPKDKVEVLARYRRAVAVAARRDYPEAILLLEEILSGDPNMADVWQRLGNVQVRAGRHADSVRSYRRLVELQPTSATAVIAVTGSLLKLQELAEARQHAELAVTVAAESDQQSLANAHVMLVRVALAQRDVEAAARHADLANQADPSLPLPVYVQARTLHADGRYAEALPLFQEAGRRLRERTITLNDVHFFTADTLGRLERYDEAEAEFLTELQLFPNNGRAHANLAMLYRSQSRDDEVERTIDDLLAAMPSPEGYELAAQLWTILGEPARADAVRADARERFPDGR